MITNITYDSRGRRTLIDPVDTAWANTTISYPTTTGSEGLAYIESGMPKMVTTQGSHKETVYFDSLWRSILTKDEDTANSLVRFARTEYDAYSNPVFQSFPTTAAAVPADTADGIETSYDALKRTVEVDENTSTGSVTYAYLDGNKIQINDNKGNVTTTTHLAYGSLSYDSPTLIAQPESVSTTMIYDIFGNMSSASQGSITQYNVYDAYKNICKIVRPDSGNQAFVVDAVGQVSWGAGGSSVSGSTSSCDTVVDASDKTTNTYDNLGRNKLVNYGDSSPDITTVYDKNGDPTSMSAGSVNTTYAYNSARFLSSESLNVDSQSFGLTYGYNSLGHLSSVTYPTSANVDFAPNAFGEATKAGSYASSVGYHPNGSISTLTYGNNRVYTTTQNSRRLPEYLKVMSGSTTVVHLKHLYDANANITTITDYVSSSANRAMTYDGLDRLKTASGIWGSGSYTYDVLGNIKTKTEGGQAMTYNYNTSINRLTSITGANAMSFTYDERGSVTNNGGHGFTYNLAGNMISSTSPSITYAYDSHKRRVKKTEGGQTSYSMYSQASTLVHKKAGGVSTDYIYAGSMLVAEKTGSTTDYMHTDLLGSPIAGNNGSSYTEYYTPWGDKWNNPIQLADDVGYTGHQSDVATGLTYMQARYYDPIVGRFMAVDPIPFITEQPATFNRYSYVGNNPINAIDPLGLASFFISRDSDFGFADERHSFLLTTNEDSGGKHSLRTRASYGARTAIGTGGVVNVTDTGRGVDNTDRTLTEQVIRSLNASNVVLPNGTRITEIDAPESVVEALIDAAQDNPDYDLVPELYGGEGINSNTYPTAIATRAAKVSGNEFKLPRGENLPGSGKSSVNQARFDENELRRNPIFCKSAGSCP